MEELPRGLLKERQETDNNNCLQPGGVDPLRALVVWDLYQKQGYGGVSIKTTASESIILR